MSLTIVDDILISFLANASFEFDHLFQGAQSVTRLHFKSSFNLNLQKWNFKGISFGKSSFAYNAIVI
jgi:hypothetical protein